MKKCKKVKLNAGMNSFEELTKSTLKIMDDGENLAGRLITCLAAQGATRDALMTCAYAMTKAWAALIVIGENAGVDVTQVTKLLLPSFVDEVQGNLDDAEQSTTPSDN